MKDIVKVTVNLPVDELEDLKRLAADQKITVTEALRRAIATEKFLREEAKAGSKVLLRDPDKSYREIVLR